MPGKRRKSQQRADQTTTPSRAPAPDPRPGPLTRKQATDELIAAGMSGEQAVQLLASARRDGEAESPRVNRKVRLTGEGDNYLVMKINS